MIEKKFLDGFIWRKLIAFDSARGLTPHSRRAKPRRGSRLRRSGNPQKYVALDECIRGGERTARLLNEPADHAVFISQFLTGKIFEAIKTINTATTANPDMVQIISRLKDSGYELKWKALDGLVPSNPDKVLKRIENKDGLDVLVPASSAIEIVLRHGLEKKPTIKELIKLLNQS